jgi:MFS family permease
MVATGSGVILFLIGLPLVQYIRHDPEEVGEKVDGIRSERLLQSPSGSKEAHSMTWREALKTPAFWLISAGHGIALLTVSTVIVHLIPFLTRSFEMSLTTAGVVFGTVSTFQFVGQLFGGYLGDRFDKRLLCVGCMLAHGSGLLILVYFESLWMTLLFSLLHGLAWGIRGPLMVALRADYFGSKSFGLIMGISSMIVMLGTMGGPVISGVMVDHFGDYRLAFQGIALSASIGAVCFWAARKPKRDELEEEGKGEELKRTGGREHLRSDQSA